jgi:hypothetical protein
MEASAFQKEEDSEKEVTAALYTYNQSDFFISLECSGGL